MTLADRAALVATARRRIARGSRSFSLASRLFDRETRERVWLLYSWCRACDDMMDGQHLGRSAVVPVDEHAFETLHSMTEAALRGESCGDPAFDGLAVLLRECPVPTAFVRDHVFGFQLDSEAWTPRTLGDLLTYCYHVAGVVGCMMAVVMGISPERDDVLDRAADLGIAFQLANISRDVVDDHALGRCYLPAAWLEANSVPPAEHCSERHRESLIQMVAALTDLAGRYERSAHSGLRHLPYRSRWAVLAATRIYGAIGREVARRGARAWEERVTIGAYQKFRHVMGARRDASSCGASADDRWGLWTRPRATHA